MGAVFDGEAFGKTIVEAVNASIDRAIGPLVKRLEALESNMVASQEIGKDLRSIVETVSAIPVVKDDTIRAMVDTAVSNTQELIQLAAEKAVAAIELPTPKDGKDVDMDAVRSMIVEECKDVRAALESTIGPEMQTALSIMVTEAFKALPVPVAPELPDIAGMITDAVKAIEIPKPPVYELPDIPTMVKEAVEAIPVPVAPELPDIAGMVGDAVSKAVDMEALKTEIVSQVQVERVELEKALAVDVPLMVKNSVDALPKPADGKSVTVDDVKPLLVDLVKEAVEAIPVPADGKSVTVDDVRPLIDDAVSKAVGEIKIEVPDFGPMIEETAKSIIDDGFKRFEKESLTRHEAAIAAIPIPTDGKSVTVDDVRPLIDDAVSKAVSAIPVPQNGKDGADAVDCFVDKRGHLIVTFSTGKTKDVGQVVGDDGVDCDIDGVWKLINEKLDSWPKPKDGLGFDDMAVEYDGERTIKFVLVRENERKEFAFDLPIPLYQGLFSDGKSYAKGDSVTFDGSVWIAQIDNATKKPGENNSEWRLAVKRGKAGRNGADAVLPEKKPVQLGV